MVDKIFYLSKNVKLFLPKVQKHVQNDNFFIMPYLQLFVKLYTTVYVMIMLKPYLDNIITSRDILLRIAEILNMFLTEWLSKFV